MPVIACPKCQGKLKLPDNMEPRRVKCPNCAAVFMSSEAPPASGAAPPPAAKRKSAPGAAESKAPQRGGPEKDFDFDDDDEDRRPRARRERDDEDDGDRPRRRRRDDDEEEEDRPQARRRRDDNEEDRPRRRRDDDEEEDRPRARRRRDEDDEDHDDEDRPRRRRRRDEDDVYEEDPKRAKKRAAAQFGRAETAALLNMISLWLAAGSAGIFGLGLLLAGLGVVEAMGAMALISGLLGLGSLGTGAVAYGFAIAGPRKDGAVGLAIATAAVTFVEVIIIIIGAIQASDSAPRGMRGGGASAGFFTGSALALCSTLSPMLSTFGRNLGVGAGLGVGASTVPIMMLFIVLLEIARYILVFLYLKTVAGIVKDRGTAGSCKTWVITYSCVVGGVFIFGLLMGVITAATKGEGSQIMAILLALVAWGGICAVKCWGAMVAGKVRNSLRYG